MNKTIMGKDATGCKPIYQPWLTQNSSHKEETFFNYLDDAQLQAHLYGFGLRLQEQSHQAYN